MLNISDAGGNEPRVTSDHHAVFHIEPLRVLLVEDISSDALLLRLTINASLLPCDIHTLHKGDEMMPWLRQQLAEDALPDIILLDLGLPHLDGFQLLEELEKSGSPLRAIPIVILTGYDEFDYIRKSYNLSIRAYLTKPCRVDKIHEILTHILRGKSAASAPF